MNDAVIRPMHPEDVALAERLSAESFHELEGRQSRRSDPEPRLRPPERAAGWVDRTQHLLRTDPGGCWVAEDETGLVGIATSFNREKCWFLGTYAVRPSQQGRGIGKALMAAALHHGRGSLRGMLSGSSDPKAARVYRQAGFSLHPQMYLMGNVDRSAIPVIEKVREGSAGDFELMDSIDRRTRGSAHGPDHELMLGAVAAGRVRHQHGVGLRLRRPPRRGRCWRPPTGGRPRDCCGPPWPTAGTTWSSPTSLPRTSGPSTSGWRHGSSCTRRATSGSAACHRPLPTSTTGRCSDGE